MLGGLKRIFGQGEDLAPLEQALLKITSDVWEVEAKTRGQNYPSFAFIDETDPRWEETNRRVEESFRRLLDRWPEEDLTVRAADMYFNSRPWYGRYAWDHTRPESVRWLLPAQGNIILFLLDRWVSSHPPVDLVDRLRRRLDSLLADPKQAPPVSFSYTYRYPPLMVSCLKLLRDREGPEATALILDLLSSLGARDALPGYQEFSTDFTNALPWMLERLWQAGHFDERVLEEALKPLPFALQAASSPPAPEGAFQRFHRSDIDPRFRSLVRDMVSRMARRWAEDLNESNAAAFQHLSRLEGSWWLLQACGYIERPGYKSLRAKDNPRGGELLGAVARMCRVERIVEDDAGVIRALRAFEEKTLLTVLPIATGYQDLICEALGWDGADELLRLIRKTASFDEAQSVYDRDVRNSPDVTNGVLDPARVRELHSRLGEKRFGALVKLYADRNDGAKNTVYLLQAALGTNRAKVMDGFARRNQIAVKALGLLPLEQPEELLRRYLALKEFARETSQFGMQRQTTERAAVQVALANLALNAGYADALRLEWAMEDRAGTALGAGGREWAVDGQYLVRLEVESGSPELVAYKEGKPLRTLPAAVKAHPDYESMKELKAQLRSQAGRYRRALEGVLASGEELAPEELRTLARHPVAARLLSALLLLDPSGRVGLFCPEEIALETLDGGRHPVEGPVRIAHPLDLHRPGLLASWQRELVRRRVVQPFKQAFRELYLVTPAEEETRTYSNRFAGQVVDANRAARLLQSEGWDCTGEDYPRKAFRQAGLTAHLSFAEGYHYMGEVESLVMDRIFFAPVGRGSRWSQANWRPLAEVPPILFSEVMRDADLVASVAQYVAPPEREAQAASGSTPYVPTEEVMERRADLVRSLAEDLGLHGVTVDGHFARVKGKLANYRVHLGSAVIHIEPGAYLCIVPSGWGMKHNRLFLPFESEDLKSSEVVSKVLLLAEDEKIKDESILRQIRARRPV